jgi:hypothetical protein
MLDAVTLEVLVQDRRQRLLDEAAASRVRRRGPSPRMRVGSLLIRLGSRLGHQGMSAPPLARRSWPVTNDEASEAK